MCVNLLLKMLAECSVNKLERHCNTWPNSSLYAVSSLGNNKLVTIGEKVNDAADMRPRRIFSIASNVARSLRIKFIQA